MLTRLKGARAKTSEVAARLIRQAVRNQSIAWMRFYRLQDRTHIFLLRYRSQAVALLLIVLIATSFSFTDFIQPKIAALFAADSPRSTAFWALLSQIGGALIAVTAISFSVIVFAQQINVNRMPHGLFWRFSAGGRTLLAFAGVFFLAIAIAFAGLIHNAELVAVVVIGSLWGIVLIFVLLIYAFRRSLLLINPINQLRILLDDATRGLKLWGSRARRARPLLEPDSQKTVGDESAFSPRIDTPRLLYFQANPHWSDGASRAIEYAITFARRFSEQGDYQVASAAFGVLVQVNAAYVDAKGNTFFASGWPFQHALQTDGFINNSLELLRQTVGIGLARKDERQTEESLRAMANLAGVYLNISYTSPLAQKSHAHLAAGYLSNAVEAAAQQRLTDVVMEGLRLMGQTAISFMINAGLNDVVTLADKIGVIGGVGVINEHQRPITLTAVEQLTNLTLALLGKDHHDIGFAAKKIRGNIVFIAKILLQLPDTSFASMHSANLAPYYSGTSSGALQARLTDWVNAIVAADSSNAAAKSALRNFEAWAEDLYQSEKELLLLAIEKRSFLAFDLIHWIEHISKLLLGLTKAPACDEHLKEELEKRAIWLLSVFSFIPDDKGSINFIDSYHPSEILFDSAIDALARGFEEFSQVAGDLLLQWGFKASRYESGWGTLKSAILGSAVLALSSSKPDAVAALKAKMVQFLARPGSVDDNERRRTARNIRKRAESLHRGDRLSSRIEREIARADKKVLRQVLFDLASILSPEDDA